MFQRTMEAVNVGNTCRTCSALLCATVIIVTMLSVVDSGLVPTRTVVTSPKEETWCNYRNKTYKSNHKFRPDPCTHCKCPEHGGEATCSVQDCFAEPNCLKIKKRKHECCGTCLLYGCQHSDGKIYQPGASIPTHNHCEVCSCPKEGGATICRHTTRCAPVSCVNPVHVAGDCCPRCPDGDNNYCWLVVDGRKEVLQAGETRTLDDCRQCSCPTGNLHVPIYMRARVPEAFCTMGVC